MFACSYAGTEQLSGYRESVPIAFRAITIPNIDGKYDTTLVKAIDSAGRTVMVDEWNDTSRQRMCPYFGNGIIGGNAIAEFSMKYDENNLYVLIDFPTNMRPGYDPKKQDELNIDSFSIGFDTMCNGGQLPQTDDYIFMMGIKPDPVAPFGFYWYARQGTGNGWTKPLNSSSPIYSGIWTWPGISESNNNFTKLPHMFVEWKFPRRLFTSSETLKVRIFAYDLGTDLMAIWPKEAVTTRNIDLYGSVALSTQIVPEFPLFVAPAMSILAASMLLRQRQSKKRQDENPSVKRNA
jgi:hypothetical protein